jgi:hypothetical protein
MPGLSAVVIARDEDQDLVPAIRSVSFADEVLVMESGAAGRARARSRPPGVRVMHHAFDGDGPTKRRAVAGAQHDWVLCVHGDEEVTAGLAAAVRELLAGGSPACAAYRVQLVTTFMGRPLMHGSASSPLAVRLFDRRLAAWSSAPVHAEVVVSGATGATGQLPGPVLHHATRDLSEAIAGMNAESTLAALEVALSGRRRSGLSMVLSAASQFGRHYLLKQGFRDGLPGLAWCFVGAVGTAVTEMKAEELMADVAAPPPDAASGLPEPTGAAPIAAHGEDGEEPPDERGIVPRSPDAEDRVDYH